MFNCSRSSNEFVRPSYEKPSPVLRMTWQPSNTTESNPDEISRRQKEIESQQIDEWMIAQGATLPVQQSTSNSLISGTGIKIPRLSSEFSTTTEELIDSKQSSQVESLTLTNLENHSHTMLVLPTANNTNTQN